MRKYRLAFNNEKVEIIAKNKKDALKKANDICAEDSCHAIEWTGGDCDFIAVFNSLKHNCFSLKFKNKEVLDIDNNGILMF